MAFLSIASAVGTLVPQDLPPAFYIDQYGQALGQLAVNIGITNIYHSWWFTAAEVWLAISLSICTFYRAKTALNLSPRDFKRGLGAWGLTILHVSLILILTALVLTPRVSTEETVNAVPGESVALTDEGFPFDLQIEDFLIDRYPNGTPKQFITRCAVLEDDKVVQDCDISVNHPLAYRGTKVYQLDCGWVLIGRLGGQRYKIASGQKVSLGAGYELGLWFYPDYIYNKEGSSTRSQQPLNPRMIYVFYRQGQPFARGILSPGQTGAATFGEIQFERYSRYTTLGVKRNPLLVYTLGAFVLAAVGVLAHLIWNPRRHPEGPEWIKEKTPDTPY
ncbi:MAG: cytochrome c biogenesis protein ResB [Bacillota bacterium]